MSKRSIFAQRAILGGLALFLCLFNAQAYAANAYFRGTVIDTVRNKPVSGASVSVSILSGRLKTSTQTNSEGYYQLSIPVPVSIANATMTASKSGYTSQSRTLLIRPNGYYPVSFNIKLKDITPPRGLISINNGAQSTNSTSVTLNLTAQDEIGGSGLDQMKFSNDNLSWTTPEPFAKTKAWQLPSGSGLKKVYVRFSDKAGNWCNPASDSITLLLPPKAVQLNPVFQLKDSSKQTLSGRKDANSSVCINGTQVVEVNSFDTWLYEYPLIPGVNNLVLTSKDTGGNTSSPVSLTVDTASDQNLLDIAPPRISSIKVVPPNMDILLTIQGAPGILSYNIYYRNVLTEPSWHLAQAGVPAASGGLTQWRDDGTYTGAHPMQVAQRYYTVEIASLEQVPPTGSISINNGASSTVANKVMLYLSAQDNIGGSGISEMTLSNNGTSWLQPEPFATEKIWPLTPGVGLKTVYVKFKDKAGNWSTVYSDAIEVVTAQGEQYVQRDGAFFRLGNDRFNFAGANCYYLMMYAADSGTRYAVDEIFTDAKAMGLKVLRLWAFNDRPGDWQCLQSAPGVFDENVLRGLDYVLYKADQSGIKVILTLVNNWPDYGGMDQYVRWDKTYGTGPVTAAVHADFYTDSDCKKWYKNFAAMLMNRRNTRNNRIYKEDPAIFAWELANEPRASGDPAGNIIQSWVEEMSFYFKKNIGIKQMLSIGSEGAEYFLSDVGTDLVRNNSLDSIDFITVHAWPSSYGKTPNELVSWLDSLITLSQQDLNKPLVLEEFNTRKNQGIPQRDQFFQDVFNKVYDRKAGGAIFWALYHDNYPDYDGNGVYYPADASTVQVITTQSARNPFRVIQVPQDYATIQAAIDASAPGDIILISPGVYFENILLNTAKAVVLQGIDANSCVVDGGKKGRVFTTVRWGSHAPSRISGLSIRGGFLNTYNDSLGAGIYIATGESPSRVEVSSCLIYDNSCAYNGDEAAGAGIACSTNSDYLIIKDNSIYNNYAQAIGGGIFVYADRAKIFGNDIRNNRAHLAGGGIYSAGGEKITGNRIFSNTASEYGGGGICVSGNATIANNLIKDNLKNGGGWYGANVSSGGGILCRPWGASNPRITNNIIYRNSCYHGGSDYVARGGGGISVLGSAFPLIKNNIFYLNLTEGKGNEIFVESGSNADINYSLVDPAGVAGVNLGVGCIDGPPKFIDTNDFYLSGDSPAKDSGDPDSQFNDLNGTRNDMGIYGGPHSF